MIKVTNRFGEIKEYDDLTGGHYGQVTVVGLRRISKYEPIWNCVCDCGRRCVFGSESLLKEDSVFHKRSCCFHKRYGMYEQTAIRRGIYRTWAHMKRRCSNDKDPAYRNYGARGIYVCNEWANNFEVFFSYVKSLDHFNEPGRSLDRIDNNDGYRPGNVRWATSKEQANNTRRNKHAGQQKSEPGSNQTKAGI